MCVSLHVFLNYSTPPCLRQGPYPGSHQLARLDDQQVNSGDFFLSLCSPVLPHNVSVSGICYHAQMF